MVRVPCVFIFWAAREKVSQHIKQANTQGLHDIDKAEGRKLNFLPKNQGRISHDHTV